MPSADRFARVEVGLALTKLARSTACIPSMLISKTRRIFLPPWPLPSSERDGTGKASVKARLARATTRFILIKFLLVDWEQRSGLRPKAPKGAVDRENMSPCGENTIGIGKGNRQSGGRTI